MPLENKCNNISSYNSSSSNTMRKDPALPSTTTTTPSSPVSSPPPFLYDQDCHKMHDKKLVKFSPHDLHRVAATSGESSSSCLLQELLQESDSVSTAESTSCSTSSSSSKASSSSSSSSSSSNHHHHCPTTTTSTTGLLRHRTNRDYFALTPLVKTDDTAILDEVSQVDALHDDGLQLPPCCSRYDSPKHPHPQQQHHHYQDRNFAQHHCCSSNGTTTTRRRAYFNHVFATAQKQLNTTAWRGMILTLVLMGMMLVIHFDSPRPYWYSYFSSLASTTTTTTPLPRLPPLLLTTTTTTTASSDVNNNPLAMSALGTQKLLQKINRASASSSPTTNNNKKKKQHQHHQHFTLRLQGSRVDLLHMSLDQHANCPGVAHVQIDWTGPSPLVRASTTSSSSSSIRRLSGSTRTTTTSANDIDESSMILQEQQEQSSNGAFVPFTLLHHASNKVGPIDSATTHAAVFLLNERVSLSCRDLARAFQEWKAGPTRMVGFFPLLQPPPLQESSLSSSSSLSSIRTRNIHDDDMYYRHYSLLSDQALFVHKLYLPEAMRNVLRQESSHVCREYMLAARIAAISNETPVAMTLKNHHHHLDNIHFDKKDNIVDLDSRRRLLEEADKNRLECLPLLLEAVGKTSFPITDAVYIGHDVRLPKNHVVEND